MNAIFGSILLITDELKRLLLWYQGYLIIAHITVWRAEGNKIRLD